ncbi:MAG TPA: DUF4386 domain-containing protein [Clostridia bacterium]|nr:DUF4386 domain-containing protein [Clostridia bacterium]
MSSNKKTARIAGLLFLLMVVFGLTAEIFFRQKIFAPNDITLTANNILSNAFLYRAGITSDILMALSYLLTAMALFKLLSSVDRNMASAMVVLAAAGSVLLMFNILNEIAPLYILSGNEYLNVFSTNQRQALAVFFYDLYGHGYMIGQIFFALWVLPLGMLINKAGFIPKIFGILFIVESVLGFLSVIVHFIAPNATIEAIALLPGTAAEFLFMFWLLLRGINERVLIQKSSEQGVLK